MEFIKLNPNSNAHIFWDPTQPKGDIFNDEVSGDKIAVMRPTSDLQKAITGGAILRATKEEYLEYCKKYNLKPVIETTSKSDKKSDEEKK